MKKIILLFLLIPFAFKASAYKSANVADTILVGSIDKNCPGGFEAFNMYIKKNAHPAARAYDSHKMGTTYVSFVIEPDGNVSNVCTILAAGYGMDEEAIRVISQSNHWIPATLDNKPVRCFCRVAIKFFTDFSQHTTWITAVRVE